MIVLLSASLCAVYHSRLLGTNLFSLRKLHSSRRKRCLEINFTVGRETLFYISKGCTETQAQIFFNSFHSEVPDGLLLKLGNFVLKREWTSSFLRLYSCIIRYSIFQWYTNTSYCLIVKGNVNQRVSFWVLNGNLYIGLETDIRTVYRKGMSFKIMGLVLMLHDRLKNIEQQNRSVIWTFVTFCVLVVSFPALYVFLCRLICPSNQSRYSVVWWRNIFRRNNLIILPYTKKNDLGICGHHALPFPRG